MLRILDRETDEGRLMAPPNPRLVVRLPRRACAHCGEDFSPEMAMREDGGAAGQPHALRFVTCRPCRLSEARREVA